MQMRVCTAFVWLTCLAACGGSTDTRESSGTGGANTGGASSGGTGTGGSGTGGSGTGGATGGTGGFGGSGGYGAIGGSGTDGGSYSTCLEIDDAYKAALAEAKFCNPLINAIQCTQL